MWELTLSTNPYKSKCSYSCKLITIILHTNTSVYSNKRDTWGLIQKFVAVLMIFKP